VRKSWRACLPESVLEPRCRGTCSACGWKNQSACTGQGYRQPLDELSLCSMTLLVNSVYSLTVLEKILNCLCPQRCNDERPLVIDGGTSNAHIDVATWHERYSRLRSISFEALPSNCEAASTVLQRFGSRSRFVCKALSDSVGFSTLRLSGNQSGRLDRLSDSRRGVPATLRVPVTTLDAEIGLETVFFLKLDIQGGELTALRGARRLLKEARVKWVYLEWDPALTANVSNGSGDGASVLQLLSSYSFSCVNARKESYRPWCASNEN